MSEMSEAVTTASALELAYGLLWMTAVDTRLPVGLSVSLARQALLGQLDRAGQARGILAARAVFDKARTARANPKTVAPRGPNAYQR